MVGLSRFRLFRKMARFRHRLLILLCTVPVIDGGTVALSAPGGAVIPQQSDWIDYGLVIDAGWPGSAPDVVFEGSGPCGILEKDGVLYLYWVAADDYISQSNNIGPAHRSIHVATSKDGIQWTKYAGNPVISWSSAGNPEEGAVSGGVFLDSTGRFVAYYGANTAPDSTSPSVWADVRLAESSDGFSFTERGIVLDHNDGTVWGSGDELHSVITVENPSDGNWYCYYIPGGTPQTAQLGVAWGPAPDNLSQSAPVLEAGGNVPARGGQGFALLDVDTLAFFIHQGGTINVRTTTWAALDQLSAPVETYNFRGGGAINVLLKDDTWYMFYKLWGYIGVRLAPANLTDGTPPTAPAGLSRTRSEDCVELEWAAATDTETGIAQYRIYRDAVLIGSTPGLTYTDQGLAELTSFDYEVRAVNLHGTEGPASTVSVSTLADTTGPGIARVIAGGNPNEVIVAFDEPVDAASAETSSNYSISGVAVTTATQDADPRHVILAVTSQIRERLQHLSVRNIVDQAASRNAGSSRRVFSYSGAPGLVGLWRLDEGSGSAVGDSSGAAFDGQANGTPAWGSGWRLGAMHFDGDDWVDVPNTGLLEDAATSSFTVSLMARPLTVPPDSTASNGEFTFFGNAHLGVGYDKDQRFVGRIATSAGLFEVASEVLAPGTWRHVALTRDDAAQEIHLYVDGVEVPGSPVGYTGSGGESYMQRLPEGTTHKEYWSTFRIGANSPLFDDSSNFTDGWIDEVRMFERPLTASEVEDLSRLPGDVDGDHEVNVADLNIVLLAWGPNPGHQADLDGDGSVTVRDLLIVLMHWT